MRKRHYPNIYPLDEQTQQWIIWAEKKINWLDPLMCVPDYIFTEHDLKQYVKL